MSQIALEDFIHNFNYESVHLKVRDGKATAVVYFDSYGVANDMVRKLDGQLLYGEPVTVRHDIGWFILIYMRWSLRPDFLTLKQLLQKNCFLSKLLSDYESSIDEDIQTMHAYAL